MVHSEAWSCDCRINFLLAKKMTIFISTEFLTFLLSGGDGNWRTTLTLPNILKEFNPRLKGFSTGNSKSGIRGLNLGMDNAVSSDLESQVEELISKIKRNPNLSLRDDWKVRVGLN